MDLDLTLTPIAILVIGACCAAFGSSLGLAFGAIAAVVL